MTQQRTGRLFLTGLFLTTLATLMLEILGTRLLSVLAWYHLSFFAVSIAMFGMAAGAVHVYLGGDRFVGPMAPRALASGATWLAVSIPITHVISLYIPLAPELDAVAIAALTTTTILLAIPFYASGIVVAIALTRMPGRIGITYSVDLLGAALGCLLVLPLLAQSNITSAAFVCGAIAAAAAFAFRMSAGLRGRAIDGALVVLLVLLALFNATSPNALRVAYPKGKHRSSARIDKEFWSIHGQVTTMKPWQGPAFYWGAGALADSSDVARVDMLIDGAAGTVMTRWDGDVASLGWVGHDVTATPYHLRIGSDVAIIGTGGGRDILTALWAGSNSILGIEINRAFIELLEGPYREFAGLADRPELTLVHDEARSALARSDAHFDLIQMSLIDTWAATGAGAFTLSENGLYTLEAWQLFLGRLKPHGLLSVSRWYSRENESETSRLVALASAALIESGAKKPSDHLALVVRDQVATLIASIKPLSRIDVRMLGDLASKEGFTVLLKPGKSRETSLLHRISACGTLPEIAAVVADEPYDYSVPTDARPFFFNLVRPGQVLSTGIPRDLSPGVVRGNMLATLTLAVLLVVVLVLVVAVIFIPLMRTGLPRLGGREFWMGILYFALIGMGFMFIQIGLMQRFSVLLGHPVHAVVVILFTMIAAAGLGSLLSERVTTKSRRGFLLALPLAASLTLIGTLIIIQPVISATMAASLLVRSLVVVGLVAPLSLLLGMFFPIGMRLVGKLSEEATPWMWAVNGGCGVLAGVIAVAVSMWLGIDWNLGIAAAAYALIALPALILLRSADQRDG